MVVSKKPNQIRHNDVSPLAMEPNSHLIMRLGFLCPHFKEIRVKGMSCMNKKQKLVLIGNGMAGVNTIEHLLKLAPEQYEITIFGTEPHPNYNRILLSYVLAGDSKVDDIVINPWEWYESKHIRLLTGHTVTSINVEAQTVTDDSGVTIPFDKLILPQALIPLCCRSGADKEGVMAYRTIRDCEYMITAAKSYKKAVIIGAVFLDWKLQGVSSTWA